MSTPCKLLALAIGLSLGGAATAETIVLAEPEVHTIVMKAGYAKPVRVIREGELWRVHSTNPAGAEVTIFVDAKGELLGAADVARTRIVKTTTMPKLAPAPLNEADVAAVLIDAGFHNIHDVDLDDGQWKAEADDITGEDFEVRVDASSGAIVHIEDD